MRGCTRPLSTALVVFALLAVPAWAQNGAACEIEDWRWRTEFGYIIIEGTTTCISGEIFIRIYDVDADNNENFLGVAHSYIDGFIFEVLKEGIPHPRGDLQIRYVIEALP